VKIGKKALPDRVVDSVWIFCELQSGVQCNAADFDGDRVGSGTAFSAVAACMNNLGPGLGAVGFHYADINDIAKWGLCVAMLLGRLEIFTLLVLSSPAFWRR
jgi:trk system potassium uptake protein TrkH